MKEHHGCYHEVRIFFLKDLFFTPRIHSLCRSVWRAGRQGERDGRKHERGIEHICPYYGTTISEQGQSFLSLKLAPPSTHLLANIDKASAFHTERRIIKRKETKEGEVELSPNFNDSNKSGLSFKVLHIWKWK
jgi:hypothetical protein